MAFEWYTNPVQNALGKMERQEFVRVRLQKKKSSPIILGHYHRYPHFDGFAAEFSDFMQDKYSRLAPEQKPRNISGEEYLPNPVNTKPLMLGDVPYRFHNHTPHIFRQNGERGSLNQFFEIIN